MTSFTEGVYFLTTGVIQAKLFKELNKVPGTAPEPNDACYYKSPAVALPNPDFTWQYGTVALPTTGATVTTGIYTPLDVDGKKLTAQNTTDYTDCSLTDPNARVDAVTTCGITDNAFVLDVVGTPLTATQYGFGNVPDGDNDGDGVEAEDAGKNYLLVRGLPVVVNWPEVEAAGLVGTVAMGQICVLNMKDADSGLCTDCVLICCCPLELVKLCTDILDKCIYMPYANYGIQETMAWSSGVALANISLDNTAANTITAVADQSCKVTIIDETGAVFTGILDSADLPFAINTFTIDQLINDMLGITGVKPGSVYVKFEANFDVDAYGFHLLNDIGISFGAGHLLRSCIWGAADNWLLTNGAGILSTISTIKTNTMPAVADE
jgi:hypothetical protein